MLRYNVIMIVLQKIWTWIKKYWGIIAGVVGIVAGSVIAATIFRRKNGNLRSALEAEKARSKIKKLQAARKILAEQDQIDEQEILDLDVELEENRQALEAVRESADVPDEEIAAEFDRLGF